MNRNCIVSETIYDYGFDYIGDEGWLCYNGDQCIPYQWRCGGLGPNGGAYCADGSDMAEATCVERWGPEFLEG